MHPIQVLRHIGLIEGVSFVLLVAVAMPLKYVADLPMAVKVAGWAHGLLFMLLCGALLWTMVAARWAIGRGALVFVAALLPLRPFLIDRRMKRCSAEFDATNAV